jgi:hypothetical protein
MPIPATRLRSTPARPVQLGRQQQWWVLLCLALNDGEPGVSIVDAVLFD